MEDQLITFETAKLANKKGYLGGGNKRYNRKGNFNESKAWSISAPTQTSLQEWLWDTFSIHVSIIPIKLRDEAVVKFQHRVIDFREAFIEKEVIFEHQYNTSHKEFIDQPTCWEEGLQEGLKLI